jgi:uncharacterized membrane protein YhaH (DUF805 family)|tara:strand:- start:557 stop:907 length:351 start_codon:yes stop_codon:yes gene_type:complete
MEWYISVLKQYAVFEGRARRKEYWMFSLFNFVIVIAIGIIESVIGTDGIIYSLYLLLMLIPSIAVTIRRLHDTGRSGWWLLVAFIPLVGSITLLVFLVLDSETENNHYGANPKAGE